ncbi:MAG TPA: hypothetical protein VJ547_01640 [Candidatus Thermoplasmatota archaeon]|nr:hypothetical protein [Candidatus Thermoplasmatota archaeon]
MNSEEARGRVETAALELADTLRARAAIADPAPTVEEAAMRRLLTRRVKVRRVALRGYAYAYGEALLTEAMRD